MENIFADLEPSPQYAVLAQSLAIQEILTQSILANDTIDQLARVMAEAQSCCVVLENLRLELITSSFSDSTQQRLLSPYIPGKTSPDFIRALNSKQFKKQPVQIIQGQTDFTIYRLVSAIFVGNEQLGYLSLLRTDAPFLASEMTILEYAVSFFAMQLAQDRKIADIELRLKGNFVEDLTSAKYSDRDSILNRARALDYDILQPHRVLVAEIDNMAQLTASLKQDQKAITEFKTELVQKIQALLDCTTKGMVMYKNDEIILLVQQDQNIGSADSAVNAFKQLAEEIIAEIQPIFKVKLYIGIGHACNELTDYQGSYLAAKKALEIGAFMITEGQVRSFEQFRVHALFLSTLKPAELYNYARSQLGALLDYDESHKTELLKTLQEFLYLRNSIEGTAKSLNMSVSGLKYRLEKIEKIIRQDLHDYKVSFDLQLALIILQLFGEYRIRN